MPYFQVHINRSLSTEYVVTAPNRETAEDLALMAETSKRGSNKNVLKVRADTSTNIAVSDTSKEHWNDTLTKKKN